jgi:hypothetical protein
MKVLCLPCDATDGSVEWEMLGYPANKCSRRKCTYCKIAVTAQAGVLVGVVQVQSVLSRNTKSSLNLLHR